MEVVRGMVDLARVRSAIRKVLAAARNESIAVSRAVEAHPDDADVLKLRDAHLSELDAIQALQSALDLFEKRFPQIEQAPGRLDLAEATEPFESRPARRDE